VSFLYHEIEVYASTVPVTNQYWANPNNVLGNTPTTYTTGTGGWTLTRSIEVSGFDLSAIPDNATILKYRLTVRARVNSPGNGTFTGTWSRGTAYPMTLGGSTSVTEVASVTWSINGLAADYKQQFYDARMTLSNYKSSLTGDYFTYAHLVRLWMSYEVPDPTAGTKNLYIGSGQVDKLYLGGTAVDRAYLGENLVFEEGI